MDQQPPTPPMPNTPPSQPITVTPPPIQQPTTSVPTPVTPQPTEPMQPPSPSASSATPAQLPPHNSKKVMMIVIAVIIIIVIGAAAFFFMMKKPTPAAKTTNPPVVKSAPTPTPDPTANWQVFTAQNLGFSFKYPVNWYMENTTGSKPPYIRIQNYPLQTTGGGYNPQTDKGKTFISISKKPMGNTITELKATLIQEDKQSVANLGTPVVSKEEEMVLNGNQVYYREVTLDKTPPSPVAYILDGKGNVIQLTLGLDTTSGIDVLRQILPTFTFISATPSAAPSTAQPSASGTAVPIQ